MAQAGSIFFARSPKKCIIIIIIVAGDYYEYILNVMILQCCIVESEILTVHRTVVKSRLLTWGGGDSAGGLM